MSVEKREESGKGGQIVVSFGFVCRGRVLDYEAILKLIKGYFREHGHGRLIKEIGSSDRLFLVSEHYLEREYENEKEEEKKDEQEKRGNEGDRKASR